MDRRPFRFAGRIVTMVEADFSVALHPADRAREADNPHSLVVRFGMDKPLALDAGIELAPFQIGYQTYGTLNAERSNAVLICHALTGDQHVANLHPVTQKPAWRHGRYFAQGTNPQRGLAVARLGNHITYLSDAALHRKFGRRFQDRDNPTFSFDADFQVESYLRHQGSSFVERFDANSYLYLTRAMDYFDLAADCDGVLANAFKDTPTRFCVVSFTSDWLFPTSESRAIVHALNAGMARVSFADIVTDKGHDAFLLEEPELFAIVRGFLEGAAKARGLPTARE